MSFRLRRKTRPQGDVEIYGGPLKQRSFDGGMNLDAPASEIGLNQVAYASNVICTENGLEARPGSIQISEFGFTGLTGTLLFDYKSNPLSLVSSGVNYRNAVCYNSEIRYYGENPVAATYNAVGAYDYSSGVGANHNPGTGDTTMIPYRRGFLIFNAAKITYSDSSGAFVVNSPNPVHGISSASASNNFKYRYLLTLSRISIYAASGYIGTYVATDRYTSGAEVVHESGSNDLNYNLASASTARQTDYGEIGKAAAISVSSAYALTNADLKAAFSTAVGVTNDLAAKHFTHVTIWRTATFGDALDTDGVTKLSAGNSQALFYWVADVKRSDVINGGAGFSDMFSDDAIKNNGLLLKTQGFDPMPSGSCGEVAGGWMFVSDRTNASPENYLNYCAIASSAENFGYYFKDIQKWKFNQGIRAMRANQDTLSIFCEASSHICNLTSYVTDASKLQSIPFLNYFHSVDRSIGIKDWATLDSIDENTFIAVCSDNSVRKWDTSKWGDDLAYNKVSSEIQQIVPASVNTYERGSVGKYYNGAYYLWYSKNSADTATTNCLRYGMGSPDSKYGEGSNKKAGFGWTFYTGTAFPPFKRGAQVVDESQGVQRLIVISKTTGKFYWVDSFKAFTGALDYSNVSAHSFQMDRVDTDLGGYENSNSDGVEIASTIKFRELSGNSESDILVHEETFNRWRPRVESAGYRTGLTVSMAAYKDGSLTASETITTQPKTGALKFTQEIASRRVQLSVITNVGSWRYVGIDSNFRSLDKINYATSGDNSSSESTTSYPQFQAELAVNLNNWITRREMTIDRASGTTIVATAFPTTTTGPDAKADSAYHFNSSYYTITAASSYAADFSVSFFISAPSYNLNFFSIAGTNPMSCQFTDATTISFSGLGTVTVASVAAGWHLFFIKRVGAVISVYQNGVLKGTIADAGPTSLGGGNLTLGMAAGICSIADFRAYSDVKTVNGMAYYYDNVINASGDAVMPQV